MFLIYGRQGLELGQAECGVGTDGNAGTGKHGRRGNGNLLDRAFFQRDIEDSCFRQTRINVRDQGLFVLRLT